MNAYEADVLMALAKDAAASQRALARATRMSLGKVNIALKSLRETGYLDDHNQLTERSRSLLLESAPKRAVILAAGAGLRMLPMNQEIPKGLITVRDSVLIERLIEQLNDVGIRDITVVVGYQKERFEYLIDRYGVRVIVNQDYTRTGAIYSLWLAREHLSEAYLMPSDVWFADNPFSSCELYPWYLLSTEPDAKSPIRIGKKHNLITPRPSQVGMYMTGLAYLRGDTAELLLENLRETISSRRHQYDHPAHAHWDSYMATEFSDLLMARTVDEDRFIEINTFEQLNWANQDSRAVVSRMLPQITRALSAEPSSIRAIATLKRGMTNHSLLFSRNDERYVLRLSEEKANRMVNRVHEQATYQAIEALHVGDEPLCFDMAQRIRITRYYDGARACDPADPTDVSRAMRRLRDFHETRVQVAHRFSLVEKIEHYEALRAPQPSLYDDYEVTKSMAMELAAYVATLEKDWCLCHVDCTYDNILFIPQDDGTEDIRFIDWEYAGMSDPHVDIAMFATYAMYDRVQTDSLIDAYFSEGCPASTRLKIYCYIALCGLLWSNWCEVKLLSGFEFGQYSLAQYRFAKEYCRIALPAIKRQEGDVHTDVA
jgi:CTP:phosphocholine cytidylyltransferase-like protein/thiamine kinase-like enzyme